MITHYDKQKLKKLVENFYNLTQITISIYDIGLNIICTSAAPWCPFCKQIRENSILNSRCIECDKAALNKCIKTKSINSYRCHMGLTEVAVPIVYNDITIGFMLLGQIHTGEEKSEIIKNAKIAAKEFNLDENVLLANISSIKTFSEKYITSLTEILQMAVDYIWLNNIVSIKNLSLAHSIDIYIKKNLKSDLSVEGLSRMFNISVSTLYKISNNQFGCGLQAYIINCRINAAKELLKKTDKIYTISDVANEVGISDVNYFIRIFKKQVGMTPKQFQIR